VEIRTDVKALRDSSAVLAHSSEKTRQGMYMVSLIACSSIHLWLKSHDRSACVEERRVKIIGWLSAPDHQPSHISALKQRQLGTGLWFVHGESFKAWRELPNAFLWLHGKSTFLVVPL
jgi:hypothetical protein